jgi:hypothetical protein
MEHPQRVHPARGEQRNRQKGSFDYAISDASVPIERGRTVYAKRINTVTSSRQMKWRLNLEGDDLSADQPLVRIQMSIF